MTTSTEETKSTQAKSQGKGRKASKKANTGARRAHVAPAKGKSGKKATPAKKAPTSPKSADTAPVAPEQGKSKKVPATGDAAAPAARDGSKKAEVLDLLRRDQGVAMAELMKATGWQAHSVRGFLSGTVGKKMGLAVTSTKGENRERTYSIKA